jgi:hypothetical protein
MWSSSAHAHFQVTYRALTCFTDEYYVVDHEGTSGILFQHIVSIRGTR